MSHLANQQLEDYFRDHKEELILAYLANHPESKAARALEDEAWDDFFQNRPTPEPEDYSEVDR